MASSIEVSVIPVTPFAQNCSLVVCRETNKAALIDPGGDVERLKQALSDANCCLESVFLTHGHLDHVGGAKVIADAYQVDIIGPHQGDAFWLDALDQQSAMFNFPLTKPFRPHKWLQHGESITVGNAELEVRFTPGHTPGHVIFIHHDSKRLFVGDVLFKGSVGRTDFPMGNSAQLKQSIVEQIYNLPDDYVVYPGHGPTTEVGHEKRTNPFTASTQFG